MFMVQRKANIERIQKYAKRTVERGYVPQIRLV